MNITKLPDRIKTPETCCPSVKKGKKFKNPWPSYYTLDNRYRFKYMWKRFNLPSFKSLPEEKYVKINVDLEAINKFYLSNDNNDTVQLTWFGHSAFLLQINKFTIIFDPFLSNRASPVSFVGPTRYRGRGFKSFSELPPIDLIVFSHNHYDHMDKKTIKEIYREPKNAKAHIFCPLGLKKWFSCIKVPEKQVIECDWWDDYEISRLIEEKNKKVSNTSSSYISHKITISCVPSQHFSRRSIFDRNRSLWSGWVIKSPEISYYFAGDTGYRTLPMNFDPKRVEDYAYCPAFKQIGNIYGPFDLASIPVGPMDPPGMMSAIHANPNDAVNIHLDVKSKHSVAMHWGTVANLGTFDITKEPRVLRSELEKKGIPLDEFHVTYIGEVVKVKKESEKPVNESINNN